MPSTGAVAAREESAPAPAQKSGVARSSMPLNRITPSGWLTRSICSNPNSKAEPRPLASALGTRKKIDRKRMAGKPQCIP
ncbi:MAG: hypothetical protein R3E58_02745 [Phycisphaerae bacterium]